MALVWKRREEKRRREFFVRYDSPHKLVKALSFVLLCCCNINNFEIAKLINYINYEIQKEEESCEQDFKKEREEIEKTNALS